MVDSFARVVVQEFSELFGIVKQIIVFVGKSAAIHESLVDFSVQAQNTVDAFRKGVQSKFVIASISTHQVQA